MEVTLRVNLRLVNFLGSMVMFLDHSGNRLKRAYGRQSKEYEEFEELKAGSSKKVFAYRFLSDLRDFALHNAMPIGHVRVRQFLVDPPGLEKSSSFRVLIKMHDLLNRDPRKFGALGEEIMAGPEEMDVLTLVRSASTELAKLHAQVVRIEMARATAAGQVIHSLLKEVVRTGGRASVGTYKARPDGGTLTVHEAPAGIMRFLGFVGDGGVADTLPVGGDYLMPLDALPGKTLGIPTPNNPAPTPTHVDGQGREKPDAAT